MGKVMQIDEHAPAPIREALDSGTFGAFRETYSSVLEKPAPY